VRIEFSIMVDKFISVNQAYLNGRAGSKYLSDEAKRMKSQIHHMLSHSRVKDKKIDVDSLLSVKYGFYIKNGYYKRDLDNMVKLMQDSIFEYFGVNDVFVSKIETYKIGIIEPFNNKEYLYCCISTIDNSKSLFVNDFDITVPKVVTTHARNRFEEVKDEH